MNSLLDENDEDQPQDREISLGTTMLLGIFFALALVCALFFGFGYSLGRKSVQSSGGTVAETSSGTSFGSFKPAPGKSTIEPNISNDKNGPSAAVAAPYVAPAYVAPKGVPADKAPDYASEAAPAGKAAVAPATASSVAPVATPSPASSPAAVSAMVQIAAVSHQEDADLLVSTLKRRGYNVAIHTEPQDKLLHVQVGPFSTRKDADAMRQKLLADGFNAIVK